MINTIIENQKTLKNIYYSKLDKLRETFDFNNQDITFEDMQKYALSLENELKNHFAMQEKLRNKINPEVDKLILENMLVKDILIRMINKIINGAKNKDINIFTFFDDFEEILRAYLLKEEGLFIQELNMATNENEKELIKEILNS
jgi:hypothetical protein